MRSGHGAILVSAEAQRRWRAKPTCHDANSKWDAVAARSRRRIADFALSPLRVFG
jgi:hypothetical protein